MVLSVVSCWGKKITTFGFRRKMKYRIMRLWWKVCLEKKSKIRLEHFFGKKLAGYDIAAVFTCNGLSMLADQHGTRHASSAFNRLIKHTDNNNVELDF